MSLRFHLDEHLSQSLADAMRRVSLDVTTTPEAGMIGSTDEEQLEYCRTSSRVMVTCDTDFLRLAPIASHTGIVFVRQSHPLPIGAIVRYLQQVNTTHSDATIRDLVQYFK